PIFTFAIENALFGMESARVYHITNLILHLFVVFMVYRFCLVMNISKRAAIFATLLFAIHPMRVESVAWVTERKDVLFAAFYFPALFYYVKWLQSKDRKNFYFAIIMVLFTFSLFSKIQAVALPLSMLTLDYYFKRPLQLKLIMEKIPYFGLSLAVGLLGVYMLSENESLKDVTNYSLFERLFVGSWSYCIYLVKWIVPYEMSPLYPYPGNDDIPIYFYFSVIGVAAVAALVWWAWKNEKRYIVFGITFFTFNVMFLLQILGAGQGFTADRFTYVPYFGLFFLMAVGLDKLATQQKAYENIIVYSALAYALVFSYMTYQQNKIWKNGETLWTHVLKYYDKATTPWSNRGQYYRDNGMTELALADYNQAISLKQDAGTLNSRGKLYFDSGNAQQAITDYTASINVDPTVGEVYVNRGAAYGSLQQYDQAIKDISEGLRLDPENINGYLNRSLLHYMLGNYAAAHEDHTSYLSRNPYKPEMWYERAITKRRLGRDQESIADFTQAINLQQRDLFYLERAKAYRALGNNQQALLDAQQAQALGSQDAAALIQELR
ncbi:MAG: tetratricopeptide repeat protein, partial [Bacteroidota bacterium]